MELQQNNSEQWNYYICTKIGGYMELKIIEGEKPKMAQDAEVTTVDMKGALYAERESGTEEAKTSDSKN